MLPVLANTTQKHRVIWADALRILSAFAVVWLHVAARWLKYYGAIQPPQSNWTTVAFFRTLPAFAVPCFFMLSGMFFLDTERPFSIRKTLKACLRLLIVFSFWSPFYSLGLPLHIHVPAVHSLLHGQYHIWFLPALASCYLAAPALRAVVRERETARFTLVAATVMVLLPATLRGISSRLAAALPEPEAIAFVSTPVFYFLAGAVAAKASAESSKKSFRISLVVTGFIAFLACFALTFFGRTHYGHVACFLHWRHLPVAVFSIVVFLGCKCIFEGKSLSITTERIIRFVSGLTFGIYLTHPIFLDLLPLGATYSPWLAIPAKTMVLFFLSAFSTALLKRIPLLRMVV